MNGTTRQVEAANPLEPKHNSTAEVAVLTLAEIQKLAAERRAIAEEILAQARGFEEQLLTESNAVASLVAAAEAAHASEIEAIAQRDRAHAKLAPILEAHAAAEAELASAQHALEASHGTRLRAEAEVAEMHARIELLSGTHGLSAEAVKRIVDRRIADRLRQRAIHGEA